MILQIVAKLEKQESTTTAQGIHVSEAWFSKFKKRKTKKRKRQEIATYEITNRDRPRNGRIEPKGDAERAQKLPTRYVYSGKVAFANENKGKRKDEVRDLPGMISDVKSKNAKTQKSRISTTPSVSRSRTKSRVLTLDAPELRLSMFQRSMRPNANQIRAEEKGIINDREGISSYI